MEYSLATTTTAKSTLKLVASLQARLVTKLEEFASLATRRTKELPHGNNTPSFEKKVWQRDNGRHGGGQRFQAPEALTATWSEAAQFDWARAFNAASSNISQVHYEDLPEKQMGSATALSSIVHPAHPLLPSLHIHISYTEYKSGKGYWRIMADLNPSHENESDEQAFRSALNQSSGTWYEEGIEQGDLYFYIPALSRHRGIAHFYLEEFSSGNFESDFALAQLIGEATIDAYGTLLCEKVTNLALPTAEQYLQQLNYHSLYLLQVLTLDRGTTAGLMVHSDNDIGIMGSLPARVNRKQLALWAEKLEAPQNDLLKNLVNCLPQEQPAPVTTTVKEALARTARSHYTNHPTALHLQAKGKITPPTLENHLS